MSGLSFREYLILSQGMQLPSYSLQDILNHKVELPGVDHPLPLFKEYLENGYYPFFNDPGYDQRLRNVVNLTIENDIPVYANMNIATTKKIRQLLYVVSQSVPFKPNFTKIGQTIDVHRNLVTDFLYYLERAGIIAQLRNNTGGIRLLGKIEKIYLDNTNLIYALAENRPDIGNMRETFFLSQMKIRNKIVASEKSDFEIDGYTFEVGGSGKQQKQIQDIEKAYIVKDDIEYGYNNIIPLWHFGFNY